MSWCLRTQLYQQNLRSVLSFLQDTFIDPFLNQFVHDGRNWTGILKDLPLTYKVNIICPNPRTINKNWEILVDWIIAYHIILSVLDVFCTQSHCN